MVCIARRCVVSCGVSLDLEGRFFSGLLYSNLAYLIYDSFPPLVPPDC